MKELDINRLKNILAKKGYSLRGEEPWKNWVSGSRVEITPELARKIIAFQRHFVRQPVQFEGCSLEEHIINGTWTPELLTMWFDAQYKCYRGMHTLDMLDKHNKTVSTYVEIKNYDTFGSSQADYRICQSIKKAVAALYEKQGLTLPEIEDDLWVSIIPDLIELDIYISGRTQQDSIYSELHLVLIGLLSDNRTGSYPDTLLVYKNKDNVESLRYFPCNFVPSPERYGCMPAFGLHRDAFSRTNEFKGLAQVKPIEIMKLHWTDSGFVESFPGGAIHGMSISDGVKDASPNNIPIKSSHVEDFLNYIELSCLAFNVTFFFFKERDFT